MIDLHFELRLEERMTDRVFVSVVLAPAGQDAAQVDGVAVRMLGREGEPLSTRHVLPISGALSQPMVSTVELRARGDIPPGAQVHGQAWRAEDQVEARCPCDPGTALGVHMRGRKTYPLVPERHALEPLEPEERAHLAQIFPWVNEPMVARESAGVLESSESTEEAVDDFCDQFDLGDEDAAFLKELLGEDL